MPRLACPYCNAIFDAAPDAVRPLCPRCGEGVPLSSIAPHDAAEVSALPPAAPRSRRGLLILAVVAAILAAVGVYLAMRPAQPLPKPPEDDAPKPPAATRPPLSLAGLRELPGNARFVAVIQPAAFAGYATRKGRTPEELWKSAGLPAQVFAEFRRLDLPPERIDHLALALQEAPLGVIAALVLRAEVDEEELLRKLDAKQVTDKAGRYTANLFGVPMELRKTAPNTWRFSTAGQALDPPTFPNNDHLPSGLRDSLGRLGPAAFASLATDAALPDWASDAGLKPLFQVMKQQDLAKRLAGVRAAALGLATEPELVLKLAVRSADAKFAETLKDRLSSANPEIATDGEWSTATMPFDPPKDALAALRRALGE